MKERNWADQEDETCIEATIKKQKRDMWQQVLNASVSMK